MIFGKMRKTGEYDARTRYVYFAIFRSDVKRLIQQISPRMQDIYL